MVAVTVADPSGATATADLIIAVGAKDSAPTLVSSASATTTGFLDVAAAGVAGSFGFADVDAFDTHSTTAHLVSETENGVATNLVVGDQFTAKVSQDSTGGGTGTVTWSDTLSPAATAALGANVVTETYAVTVGDGRGGTVQETIQVQVAGSAAATPVPTSYITFHGAQDDYAYGPVPSHQTSNLTLAGDVRWSGNEAIGRTETLLYVGNSASDGFGLLGKTTSGGLDLLVAEGGKQVLDTGIVVNPGTWHQVAVTDAGGALTLYLDGTRVFSASDDGGLIASSDGIEIGGNHRDAGQGFSGSIADVTLLDSALSASGIDQMRLDGAASAGGSLVGSWLLADSPGSSVGDSSGNGINLTLYGAPAFDTAGIMEARAPSLAAPSSVSGYAALSISLALSATSAFASLADPLVTIAGLPSDALLATTTDGVTSTLAASHGVFTLTAEQATGAEVTLTNYDFGSHSVSITATDAEGGAGNVASAATTETLTLLADVQASDAANATTTINVPAGDTITNAFSTTQVSGVSDDGAKLAIAANGQGITFDPTSSPSLSALTSGQSATDYFDYAYTDANDVVHEVAVDVGVQGYTHAPAISDFNVSATIVGGQATSITLSGDYPALANYTGLVSWDGGNDTQSVPVLANTFTATES